MKHTDFREDVNSIRTILEEYKWGFPVIKELIQNSNDAEAKELIIGFTEDTAGFANPLLKNNPVLYVINDGQFAALDAYAINEAIGSGKHDKITTGKFGIGLNSVFHYCEGFFYLTSSIIGSIKKINKIAEGDYEFYERTFNLVTPWDSLAPENPYRSWTEDLKADWEYDRNRAMELLSTHIREMDSWFAILIPLRKSPAVNDRDCIIKEFYNTSPDKMPNTVFNATNYSLVSYILPMLHSLARIRFVMNGEEQAVISHSDRKLPSLGAIDNSYRDKKSIRNTFLGSISLNRGQQEYRIRYVLVHDLADDDKAADVYSDRKSKEQKILPPHVGILMTQNLNCEAERSVHINYSNTLPLSLGRDSQDARYNIFLHGCFFVNSRRQYFDLAQEEEMQDEKREQVKWNQALFRQALSLLLKGLAEFNSACSINVSEMELISSAVKQEVFEKQKDVQNSDQDLCRDWLWAARVVGNKFQWELLPRQEYFVIGRKFLEHASKLPRMVETIQTNRFVCNSMGNILLNEYEQSWRDEHWEAFWCVDAKDLIADPDFLSYWLQESESHLESLGEGRSEMEELYFQAVKRLVLSLTFTAIKENSPQISKLLAHYSKRVLVLDIRQSEIWKDFNTALRDFIALPPIYRAGFPNNPAVPADVSFEVLQWLVDNREKLQSICHTLSLEILPLTPTQEWNPGHRKLSLFQIEELDNEKIFVSLEEIESLCVVASNSPKDFCRIVSRAFNKMPVYLMSLSSDQGKQLLELNHITTLSIDFISQYYERWNFSQLEDRTPLLVHLLTELGDQRKKEYKALFRAVLAGSRAVRPEEKLYISKTQSIFFKLAAALWNSRKPDYSKIAHLRDVTLNDEVAAVLNINAINDDIPEEFFEGLPEDPDLSWITDKEREALYRKLDTNEGSISPLFKLPIFETVDNKWISIYPRLDSTYIVDGEISPKDLPHSSLTILRQNPVLANCKLIKSLDDKAMTMMCLEDENPATYQDKIIQALGRLKVEEINELDLYERPWFRVGGHAVGLKNVLYHGHITNEILSIIEVYSQSVHDAEFFATRLDLPKALREDSVYDNLKKSVFWEEERVLEILGEIIGETPEFNIYPCNEEDCVTEYNLLSSVLSELEIVRLLIRCAQNVSPMKLEKHIYPNLFRKTPPMQIQAKILTTLALAIENEYSDLSGSEYYAGFMTLLKAYLDYGAGQDLLKRIILPNDNGYWREADSLCLRENLINKDNVLEKGVDNLLSADTYSDFICRPELSISGKQEEYGQEDLFQYLLGVSNHIDKTLIGVFLSFLADGEPQWKHWADATFFSEFFNAGKVRHLVKEAWKEEFCEKHTGKKDFVAHLEEMVENVFWTYTIRLRFKSFPDRSEATSITGKRLGFQTEPSFLKLTEKDYLENLYTFDFYKLDLDTLSTEKIKACLLNALNEVVLKVYDLTPVQSRVKHLVWDPYETNNQFSVSFAQETIKSEMISVFNRLGIGQAVPLVKAMQNRYKEINQEMIMSQGMDEEEVGLQYFRRHRDLFEDIGLALKDESVLAALLAGVRRELASFQYDRSSILFELFQNADDACAELNDMARKAGEYYFLVKLDRADNTIHAIHNGRFINEQEGNIYSNDRNSYYSNDLHKMLTLNYSDKQGSWLTGKFGLGFKSVYLATDDPQVVSGMLHFRIVGGVYPEPLKTEELERLKMEIPKREGTLTCIRAESSDIFAEVTKDFGRCAFLLPLVSKQVRSVEFDGKIYNPDKTDIDNHIAMYRIDHHQILAISSGDDWQLLFRISSGGLKGFDGVCPVWVTVPALGTLCHYQFVINANFQLDVGRKQLARSEHNKVLARIIGQEFARVLSDLFSSMGPEEKLHPMFTESGIGLEKFWVTLFYLITEGLGNKQELSDVEKIFWEKGQENYLEFIRTHPVVPNGLASKYHCLVCLDEIQYVVPDFLNVPVNLSVLENSELPNTILINREVYSRLGWLADELGIQELNYSQMAHALCPDKNLTPAAAERLGRVLQLNDKKISPETWEELSVTLRFAACDGSWQSACDLILAEDIDLYGFVSEANIFSVEYGKTSLWLFEKLTSDNKIIDRSIELADGEIQQKHALSYLLHNLEKHHETALRTDWLLMLDSSSSLVYGLDQNQMKTLEYLLKSIALQTLDPGTEKYTYKWFKTILWALNYNKKTDFNRPREIIRFNGHKVSDDRRIIELSYPSRYILLSYETARKRKLTFGSNDKTIPGFEIESVSLSPEYVEVLFDKPLTEEIIGQFESETVFSLEFEDFVDVSRLWQEAYQNLEFEEDESLKDELSENIQFIFGPPGTGKTYTLASKLTELAQHHANILALTPTNAAADEVILKLIEQKSSLLLDTTRFGNCVNVEINDRGIVSHSGKNRLQDNVLTVTTAIRFPYDGYHNANFARTPWDYVIFDESSMLPIHYIVYVIIRASLTNPNCRFIVAGDPLQIPPIYNFPQDVEDKQLREKLIEFTEQIVDETIYEMVGLKKFETRSEMYRLSPYEYHVEPLMTQRRSIDQIGELFSRYCYEGKIKHAAQIDPDTIPKLPASKYFEPKPITIVRCPVIGGDVFHSRYVRQSATHPYSALLAVEYVRSIEKILGSEHSIGVVCPYRSQADMVKKLMAKQDFAELDYHVDTIHGFQGGQKDIIICIFNTPVKYPPQVSEARFSNDSKHKLMLNKRYIINVGISRARKYLFLLIPDSYYKEKDRNIIGFDNLKELNILLNIIKGRIGQQYFTDVKAESLEKHLFKSQDFITRNSILIPHDKVNVYHHSPKQYLISYDENNIDVQLDYRTPDSRGELESVNDQSDKKVSKPAKLES